jgi:DNA polymerase
MQTLTIDIETFSSADLKTSGVYKYVQASDFEILLFAYAVDEDAVEIVDLAQGEGLPEKILVALTSPYVLKTAHNANFERTCISQHFKTYLPVEQWCCTMAKAAMLGLPLSLDAASKALKLSNEKSSAGKGLIRYFSIPCKPTKANGQRTRNLPHHDLQKWQQFKDYCVQDVVVERAINKKISFFTVPAAETRLWQLDQIINDTGVLLDKQFVKNAIIMDKTYREKLTAEAIELTGLDNPNSAAQLKKWLTTETGEEVTTLRSTDIPELLKSAPTGTVTRVLELRQEMSKTSIKKYSAMMNCVCSDSRVRGLLQYYGANRTGRWAGRLVQVQNLRKNEMSDLDMAREIVKQGDLELMEILFGNVPDVLSQLIRTAFICPPGHTLIPADFSAIEARVIAWLAGEKWRLEVFNTHGKIYEASASHMFKVPIEQVTKGSDLRQKGKMSELALGYQGGPNAIIKIEISNKTPKEKRIPEEELPRLVAMWRQANKAIVNYWKTCENAAIDCVETGQPVRLNHGIRFFMERGILFIELPSKRRLTYLRPQLRPNKFGGHSLYYEGMDQEKKTWGLQQTYGGKLVENIVQAFARDCLADAMLRVHDAGYKIVMHVHDEIVNEVPTGKGSVEEINRIMGEPIPWAKGLPLRADSYETLYYKKD